MGKFEDAQVPLQNTSFQNYIIGLFQFKYQTGEQYAIVFFSLLSVVSFYPVLYTLATIHKNRGMDIVTIFAIIFSQFMYKITVAFDLQELFLTQDSWHKFLNIALLLQFCSLIIYLAKLPKQYQGYLLAFGLFLIIIMQEKDQYSFKYALVPILFNNLLLICSQCMLQKGPVYVNTRMVVYGALWYVISIVAFIGSYHRIFDFFFFFQDLTIFATGFSLFYSWQSYEKHDVTFRRFVSLQVELYREWLQKKDQDETSTGITDKGSDMNEKSRLEQKAKKKKEKQKQEKKKLILKKYQNDDEESGTLLQEIHTNKDKTYGDSSSEIILDQNDD